jgi:CRISPR-associated protein Cas2
MVAIIMESVPVGLRGELTRWMLELKSGVFMGTISARVREKLWQKICSESRRSAS